MQKLRSLEMVRAVAVLLVVMFHTQAILGTRIITPFRRLFDTGFHGVDLFFVLSGFIIAHVHARDIGRSSRLRNYLFNRATRVYPAVWIMTVFAGGLYAAGFGGADKIGKLTGWMASMFLLPQTGDALVNVTWTLKYEMFFYLIFALLILDFWVGLIAMFVWQLSVLTASILLPPEVLGLGGFYLRSICLEFGVGLACAWLLARPGFVERVQSTTVQWAITVAGIATFVCGMISETYMGSAGALCALGAGAIIVGLVLLEQSECIQVPDLLVMIGGSSYAIYLVHFSVIKVLAVVLIHIPVSMNNMVFFTVAVLGVIAGIGFDRAVDRPLQRFLRRRLKPLLLGIRKQEISQLS